MFLRPIAPLETPADIKLHRAVHAPDLLAVPGMPHALQPKKKLVKAKAGVDIHQFGECFNHWRIVRPFGRITPYGSTQAKQAASTTFTGPMGGGCVVDQFASRTGR